MVPGPSILGSWNSYGLYRWLCYATAKNDRQVKTCDKLKMFICWGTNTLQGKLAIYLSFQLRHFWGPAVPSDFIESSQVHFSCLYPTFWANEILQKGDVTSRHGPSNLVLCSIESAPRQDPFWNVAGVLCRSGREKCTALRCVFFFLSESLLFFGDSTMKLDI